MAALFSITLLISATLLFIVQPMVGRMVLPSYGGTPAVWNTCMLFFQTVLLAGYAYSHGMVAWLGVRRHAMLHVVMIALPLLLLPVDASAKSAPPANWNPVAWLLVRLAFSVGPVLFVVSATAPLLQKWFAHTSHKDASDPYFLYAFSNVGSMLALIGYPLLVERSLSLSDQSSYWGNGYILLIFFILLCAIVLLRSKQSAKDALNSSDMLKSQGDNPESSEELVSRGRRLRWIIQAMVPSSLLLGVTTHITTNIAAVPLLWVIPLSIYLITFVLVFARRVLLPHRLIVAMLPVVVLALGAITFLESAELSWLAIPPHLIMFFVVSMMCHGQLASDRPSPRHLTAFFLWISVGGALGGVFNAIVAPLVFDAIIEYPLMLVISCLLLPKRTDHSTSRLNRYLDFGFPLMLVVFLGAMSAAFVRYWHDETRIAVGVLIAFGAMLCFLMKERPVRFGLGTAVFFVVVSLHMRGTADQILLEERNFFGVKRVVLDAEGQFHTFVHGTTNHGMQSLDPGLSQEPTSYYHRSGPMGDIFRALEEMDKPSAAGIVGLGVGGIASYAQDWQHFVFYEIDPAVERIAENIQYFSYLSECSGTYEVVIGDGRLALADAADGAYDLLVLDAFSSDAVPAHLLTREALGLYIQKLNDGGVLVFNITNAYLDFMPLMGNLAADAGLVCMHRSDSSMTVRDKEAGKMPAHYVVMANREDDLGTLATDPRWQQLAADPGSPLWTDRFGDILSLLRTPKNE